MQDPMTRYKASLQLLIQNLMTSFFGTASAAGPGCAEEVEVPVASDLRLRFPDQAANVLEGSDAFAALHEGFALDSTSDFHGTLQRLHHEGREAGGRELRFRLCLVQGQGE